MRLFQRNGLQAKEKPTAKTETSPQQGRPYSKPKVEEAGTVVSRTKAVGVSPDDLLTTGSSL